MGIALIFQHDETTAKVHAREEGGWEGLTEKSHLSWILRDY